MRALPEPVPVANSPGYSAALESYATELSLNADFRVLRRLVRKQHYHTNPPAILLRGLILDTESTGTDTRVDKVVELGMALFEFCPLTGQVYRVLKTFNQMEDPGMPISEGATAVNGITDDMVAGKKFDEPEVQAFTENVDIVIAHNSGFDRAMLERRFPIFESLAWGCSYRQVDWAGEGFGTQKLDYIAYRLGFFYAAHRAESDCLALLEALQRPLPVTKGLALSHILSRYQSADYRVWALDAMFAKKDVLKQRGYSWGDGNNGTEKAWFLEVSSENYEAEIDWLRNAVYSSKKFRIARDAVDAYNRYSVRTGPRDILYF